jgi:hypothetical protein
MWRRLLQCIPVMCVCILSLYSFRILFLLLSPSSYKLLDTLLVCCIMHCGPFFDVRTVVGSFSTVCKSHTSTSWGYAPLMFIMCWSRFPYFLYLLVCGYLLLLLCVLCGALLSWCVYGVLSSGCSVILVRLVVVMGRDFVSALRPVACCTIPGWKRMTPSEREVSEPRFEPGTSRIRNRGVKTLDHVVRWGL